MKYRKVSICIMLNTVSALAVLAHVVDAKRMLDDFDKACDGRGCPQMAQDLLVKIEACPLIPQIDKRESRRKFDLTFRPAECDLKEIPLREVKDFFSKLNEWVFYHADRASAEKALMCVKGHEEIVPPPLLKGLRLQARKGVRFFHSYFPTLGSPICKSEESGLVFNWKEGVNDTSSLWINCGDGLRKVCVATNLTSATVYATKSSKWNVVMCRTWESYKWDNGKDDSLTGKIFYSQCFFARMNDGNPRIVPLNNLQERLSNGRNLRKHYYSSILEWKPDGRITIREIWSDLLPPTEIGIKKVKDEETITLLRLNNDVCILSVNVSPVE